MTVDSVCLPSDALSQHLPSYWGFSYLGRKLSLHGCFSKAQLLLLTLDVGYLLSAAPAPCSLPLPLQRQIAVKRREVKSKREKERYTHLNAEFQRTARRDKKAFLSDQCKEIEENNRMGKTRYLCKKIRDTKGIFHAKMGSIKDRNGMDLTEAEDLRRGGKNAQKNYTKRIFTTQIITMV